MKIKQKSGDEDESYTEKYDNLEFKCGIEIHQQLEGKKLFCNCPTKIRKDKPDFTIKRYLRASAGESGEFDRAAKYEQEKAKYFFYQGYTDTTCLVEMDEDPPREINKDALKSALQLCKMMNATVPERLIIMRKVVIDGSNTSGFQRTILVGMDGYVEVDGKKIGIPSICLEEESCQVIERTKEYDIYNISRLGIPLIEIATAPDIKTPKECQEVAAKIGMLLRSTGMCKRGIGTIRQDVNISIKNGARIEIKGFQDLRSIPKIVDYEIERQLDEIKKGKKVETHVRKAEPDFTTSFLRPIPSAGRMYPETDLPTITPTYDGLKDIETIEEKQKKYQEKYGLNSDFAYNVTKFEDSNGVSFEDYFNSYPNVGNTLIANIILNVPKEIKRKNNVEIDIFEHIDFILPLLEKKEISAQSVEDILTKRAKKEEVDLISYRTISEEDIEKGIKKIIEDNKGAPMGALMGKAMAHFKGRVDGKIVSEILKKFC